MALSPESIANPHLPRTLRGYSVDATHEFLRHVADEITQLRTDRTTLAERNGELERELGDLRRRVSELAGDATRSREPEPRAAITLAAAYRAAQGIREEARREGVALLKKARRRAAELEQELEREHAAKAGRVEELEDRQRQVRDRLNSFLTTMLAALEDGPSELADVVRDFQERARPPAGEPPERTHEDWR